MKIFKCLHRDVLLFIRRKPSCSYHDDNDVVYILCLYAGFSSLSVKKPFLNTSLHCLLFTCWRLREKFPLFDQTRHYLSFFSSLFNTRAKKVLICCLFDGITIYCVKWDEFMVILMAFFLFFLLNIGSWKHHWKKGRNCKKVPGRGKILSFVYYNIITCCCIFKLAYWWQCR